MSAHGPLPAFERTDAPYWETAREGRLSLQRCEACGHVSFPPTRRCHQCESRALAWKDVSGRGRIWSWVVFHRQYFPEMTPPYVVLRVVLDEGPALTANLVDSDERRLAIDAPVRAVFRPAGDLVLPQFTLLEVTS